MTSDGVTDASDINVIGQMLMQGGGGCEGEFCPLPRLVEIAYDYRNQMVQYSDIDADRVHRYRYDCFGRRVAKVIDQQNSGGVVTRFVYGGQASWQVLAEYETFQPASGVPAIASYVFGNYIDEPVQARRDFDAGGSAYANQDFYYHADELFSIVAITAGQNSTSVPGQSGTFNAGAVIERVRYGDYGNPTVMDASGNALGDESTLGNRFAFTGREYDGETEFSYYRTRYLEHAWGRFTTRDTIGVWGDAWNVGNGLAFVHSSPNSELDCFGLHPGDGLSPGDRWTPKDGWQPAPMRDIKYYAPNPEFTHKYLSDPTGAPMWLDPDLAQRFVGSPSVQNIMQEMNGIMRGMLESLYAGLRCPSPSTATRTQELRRTSDVTNVPKLFSIGNSSIGITITCTASLQCPSGKRVGGCTASYKLEDSFSDPLDIGIEIGTPYQILHDWQSGCTQ